MKSLLLPLVFFLVFSGSLSCQNKPDASLRGGALYEGQKLPKDKPLQTIAFGSCNRADLDQKMWPAVLANRPDLWIWLGDNIYADTENMGAMRSMYLKQKHHPEYRQFRASTPVIGIWDDHDYGVNDGDKTYAKKKESQQLMLDFLDVPADAAVRKQEGAYQSFTFGPKGKRVKVILLDGRYFRDQLKPGAPLSGTRYQPNEQGDVLGEKQWQWLEQELKTSDAQVHIIGCGIQFIPTEQRYEKWANFPAARKRLLDLLGKLKPKGALLISGDRHIAELNKIALSGNEYTLYELTSSGLTHTWSLGSDPEPNAFRAGDMVIARNFALIRIDWTKPVPTLRVEVRGLGNKLLLDQPVTN